MGIPVRLKKMCGILDSSINLSREDVKRVIKTHNTFSWFIYAFDNREKRWHICKPSLWIARNLPKDSVILETGCGCAFNLIWLGQNGFFRLHGADISDEALSAGRELALLAGIDVHLYKTNSLNSLNLETKIDVLLALNWTYHDNSFNLEDFLSSYEDSMRPGGHVVIDVIDASYDTLPNSVYLTSDWHLPVDERRPSEYRIRYSIKDVKLVMKKKGYEIIRIFSKKQLVPVVVYIARKKVG